MEQLQAMPPEAMVGLAAIIGFLVYKIVRSRRSKKNTTGTHSGGGGGKPPTHHK